MENKKKYCDYHGKECYIWKAEGKKRYCKDGWSRILAERDKKEYKEETETNERIEQTREKTQVQISNNPISHKKAMVNRNKNQLLITILDKQLRIYLLLVKPNQCFTCDYIPQDKKELQVGHYIGRKIYSLRWDLQNVELQCSNCNCFYFGDISEYRKRMSEERYNYLITKSREVYKLSESDLQNKINELKNLIKDVSKNNMG